VARILVDTDVLVAHLGGQRRFDPGDAEIYVSTITRAELLASRASDYGPIMRVLDASREVALDAAVVERAGRIRRLTGVRLGDAIIAASAIEHDLMLVTTNIWAFKGIDGLDATAP
jgi:predicted nucleic acid-binding protein